MDNSSNNKEKARDLRRIGKTYRQISQILLIPLSTVFEWTKNIQLTQEQKELIKKVHQEKFISGRLKKAKEQKIKTQNKKLSLRKSGLEMVGQITKRELQLVGAALYWAEGFKKDSRLGFANSDPMMIRLVLRWLIEIGNVDVSSIRLRVGVNIQHKYRIKNIEKEWSRLTGINLVQFQKPFFQKTKWKRDYKNKENYLGVLRVRINSNTQLFVKILGMLDGLKSNAC